MSTTSPKISVLMSVYNGADYLQEAIDSILEQTYRDFEFIILDDCSTDNTWEILTENAAIDDRIMLIKNDENLGLIKSLNKGLKAARGEFIARQDADDISLPYRFQKEIAVLDQQPDCVLVSGNLQIIENNNKKVVGTLRRECDSALVTWYLLFHNRIAGHSQVMYRRDSVLALGGYSEAHPYMEDYELWCRLSHTGKRLVILPDILLTYRRHAQSVSVQKREQQEKNDYKQAQDNLQNLLGQPVPLETVKCLTGFWKGKRNQITSQKHRQFPSGSEASIVHEMNLKIKDAFIQKYQISLGDPELSQKLDAAIAQQFLYWLRSPLTKQHSVWSKVQISRYALLWSSVGVLQAWLTWLCRSPIDFGITVLRKTGLFDQFKNTFNVAIRA